MARGDSAAAERRAIGRDVVPLQSSTAEDCVWRLKAVAQAQPDALARVLLLLETQSLVPCRLTAQRVPVRGRTTPVLEIEIELAAADVTPNALRHLVATIAALPTVLTAVVPDPINANSA
jgi:hypothetical protein